MQRRTRRNLENRSKLKYWYYAIYVRKSSEEEDSRSIKNQISVIREYINKLADIDTNSVYECIDEYIDEDDTGTDTNRFNFQRLLTDLRNKKINMVIVTDSSRLSRNTSDSLYYIQNLFVKLDIRFISMQLPQLDTYLEPEKIHSIELPIQSIFNEKHCADTSEKVNRTFKRMRENGDFTGGFPPYGYKRDPNNKYRFVVDEEAAANVKNIYEWFLNGMSLRGIAKKLNELGVPNPTKYKELIGLNYKHPGGNSSGLWHARSIKIILSNLSYLGHMVQGKEKVKSYLIHDRISVPEDEWVIVEDRHTPIIEQHLFDTVQTLLIRDTRTPPKGDTVYIFSGFLRCADCNMIMRRSPNKNQVYYHCRTYKDLSKTACTIHTIKHEELENAVLSALNREISIAVSLEELTEEINNSPYVKRQTLQLGKELQRKERELSELKELKKSLYTSLHKKLITELDYQELQDGYTNDIERVTDNIHAIQTEITKTEKIINKDNPFLERFKKHGQIERLTREIIAEFIEDIFVHEDKKITVKFNFSDELLIIKDFIKFNNPIFEKIS